MREYLQRSFTPEQFYCGPSNERFRRQLYDIYLGGLDMEKFPKLFKRAISFRMNIKLEDFVKEYICMEQDIHIEDLQESVMQYGRMRSKIEETMEEIRRLKLICGKYEQYAEKSDEEKVCSYQIDRLEIMNHEVKSQEARDRIKVRQEAIEDLKKQQQVLEQEEKDLQKCFCRGAGLGFRVSFCISSSISQKPFPSVGWSLGTISLSGCPNISGRLFFFFLSFELNKPLTAAIIRKTIYNQSPTLSINFDYFCTSKCKKNN